jgi:hypothetical protein
MMIPPWFSACRRLLSSRVVVAAAMTGFVSSSGVDTFCPRLFFCSEVCRDDAWNAMALVFRSNHCEENIR